MGDVPTKKQRRLEARLTQIVRHRYLDRMTVTEVARAMERSERAIYLDMARPEYEPLLDELKREWREQDRAQLAEMGQLAVNTLRDLMLHDRSGHVRFEAAAKVADLTGVGVQIEGEQTDDREEALRLQQLLLQRATVRELSTLVHLIGPGGLLPEQVTRPPSLGGAVVEGQLVPDETATSVGAVLAAHPPRADRPVSDTAP
jgi:hypothetical protein